MIYWRVGNIIIWNLVLEQRHFKGTKMAFKKSQCLFVPYLFSNIKCSWKHLNYNLRVLCIYDHDSFNMRSSCYIFSFFFFTENTHENSGYSLQALRGQADVWEGFGGRPPLSRPPCEGTFCLAVGLQLLGKGSHLSQS